MEKTNINKSKRHKIFGRPRATIEEKRSVKVSVFFTAAEAAEIKMKCEELNLTLPEFLRRAGLNKKIEARKSVFDAAALAELRAAGQNINCTARELSRLRVEVLPLDLGSLRVILEGQTAVLQRLKNSIFTTFQS